MYFNNWWFILKSLNYLDPKFDLQEVLRKRMYGGEEDFSDF